jgi:hypothetical protein
MLIFQYLQDTENPFFERRVSKQHLQCLLFIFWGLTVLSVFWEGGGFLPGIALVVIGVFSIR